MPTALMIHFTGKCNVVNPFGAFLMKNVKGLASCSEFTQQAINTHFPNVGSGFVSIALHFFAVTTIMAYYYVAEVNLSLLMRKGDHNIRVGALYGLIMAATFYGSIKTAEVAWTTEISGCGSWPS